MQFGALDERLVGLVAVHDVPAHRQVGRVDLELEPGGHDGLVLGAHRLADRPQVVLGRRVVLVGQEEGDDARRRRVHERPRDVLPGQRAAEGREVALEGLAMLVGDRPPADGPLVPGARPGLHLTVAKPRERVEVGRRRARGVTELEPAQAMADVRRVPDLAHLAVADDVDPGLDLTGHAIGDGGPDDPVELRALDLAPVVLGEDDIHDVVGPREAPDVGGEDAVLRRRCPLPSRTDDGETPGRP